MEETKNKGVYLHDIPVDQFLKYFFSGAYETDYISDRYSPVMEDVSMDVYYSQEYTLTYVDSTNTQQTKVISVKIAGKNGNVDITKFPSNQVEAILGIVPENYYNCVLKQTKSEETTADSGAKIYELGDWIDDFDGIGNISVYPYYFLINGKYGYGVELENNEFKRLGQKFTGSDYLIVKNSDNSPKKYYSSEYKSYYYMVKDQSGSEVGKIFECATQKAQLVENGSNIFLDKYNNTQVGFSDDDYPVSPIEKYNQYMRKAKEQIWTKFNDKSEVNYGNMWLFENSSGLSLNYQEKTTDTIFTTVLSASTTLRDVPKTTMTCIGGQRKARAYNTILSAGNLSSNITSIIATGITAIDASSGNPVTVTMSDHRDQFSIIKTSEKNTYQQLQYSDSVFPKTFDLDSSSIDITSLKTFLNTYQQASGNQITTQNPVCIRLNNSKCAISNMSLWLSRIGVAKTIRSKNIKIANAKAIYDRLPSGNTITGQQLKQIFIGLGFYYNDGNEKIPSDTLYQAYLSSGKDIMTAVSKSTDQASYSGQYSGTDYLKTLYLYLNGLQTVCSSVLGSSLSPNEGTNYTSLSNGKIYSGFIPLKDIYLVSTTNIGNKTQQDNYIYPFAIENAVNKSELMTSSEKEVKDRSYLRRLHDYDSYETNAKAIYELAKTKAVRQQLSGVKAVDTAKIGEASTERNVAENKKNDFSDYAKQLSAFIAKYLFAYSPQNSSVSSSTTSLDFFRDDFSERFQSKSVSDKNEFTVESQRQSGMAKYVFGQDPTTNLSVFKYALLTKLGRPTK